jgi:xylulokinase
MFVGLDLGTSSLKAILVDEAQAIVAEATAPLTVERPHDGWSEQDPDSWIAACKAAMAALAGKASLAGVKGIGLSGHMHGATLIDRADKVLRPCILWNDTRSHAEAAELDGDEKFRRLTGNIVFPGFTAPKLVWVRRHEPGTFAKVAKVLLPKDYLRLWLTGGHVGEMSDAAGTAWLDTGARDWSDELLASTDLSRDHMPSLVEGSAVSGTLRPELATEWGMGTVPVAGGGGDNAAAAVGLGVVKAGQAFVSLGTSGVLFAANDGYQPDPATAVHTFCHALPDTWHQMGVILAATDALNWLARVLDTSPGALTADLGPLQAPGKTVFLPYLGGERTPLNNAAIRGAFTGLEHAADAPALARAVLEGVTFAIRDCRDALAATGTRIDRLLATGGGARSDYWLQAIATALSTPIDLPAAGDFGAALGAARLGMMAAGAGADVATMPPIARSIDPVEALDDAFDDGHAAYQHWRDGIAELTRGT